MENARAIAAEFLGTFLLVFIGTSVATLSTVMDYGPAGFIATGLAFGGTLAVLVLVIGPVSGCHVNPAVSLAMVIAGQLRSADLPSYLVAQVLGGLLASLCLYGLLTGLPEYSLADHGLGANGNPQSLEPWALFGWEFILSAFFIWVILAMGRKQATPLAGALAIGGYLFLAHLIGVPLGDASLNPARSLGPALVQGHTALSTLWIFLLAPLLGGIGGVFLHRVVTAESE